MKKSKTPRLTLILSIATGLLILLAGIFVYLTLAAGPSANREAEDATPDEFAKVISDPAASNSEALQFLGQSTTPDDGNFETVNVSDATSLQTALDNAQPGQHIVMADGSYGGKFTITKPAAADKPIKLSGSRGAIIDGGDLNSGYALYLGNADYWHLEGFTITNREKGLMADDIDFTTIKGLYVHTIGNEAIHIRSNSSDNTIDGNEITNTGLTNIEFGEGIYVGSANNNWGTTSVGGTVTIPTPDKSDNNKLINNNIYKTGGESMDIKEGTTGGLIKGNTFDGAEMGGPYADSWIDMKGNGWTIEGNKGKNAKADAFQVHANSIEGEWGHDNIFTGNIIESGVPGYGFNIGSASGNTVKCDNQAPGAAKGLSDIECTP
ncbi:right-handed parallel beta-helix repeat-containing protein [Candidatus Saccharibacteria bacterium]|nr:right-handed parallel beta-helix repeat-containing protein [Candidatus Saccharibacteria bacterium]